MGVYEKPWETRSYSKSEVMGAIDKVEKIPHFDRNDAKKVIFDMCESAHRPGAAVDFIYEKENYTPCKNIEYNRFDSWDVELEPPKVESWHIFNSGSSYRDIVSTFKPKPHSDKEYYVYCIEVVFPYNSLQQLEQEAMLALSKAPNWLQKAYNSVRSFYIGYSGNFGERLKTHAVKTLSASPPPSQFTALADICGVGIVEQFDEKELAIEYEEKYASNFQNVAEHLPVYIHQN